MNVKLVLATFILCVCALSAAAQKTSKAPTTEAQRPNPDIQKMIKEVSAKNIQAIDLKLVSFGSRNTLSEQDTPTRGIGAARDWIFATFQQISKDCGG